MDTKEDMQSNELNQRVKKWRILLIDNLCMRRKGD